MKKCFFALLALCVSGFPAFCQEKTYKVGDVFYEDSEVVGVVFSVSDGGRHGKVVSLHDLTNVGLCWGDTYGIGNVGWGREAFRLYRSDDNKEILHQTVTEEVALKANSGATDWNDGALNCRRIARNYYYKTMSDGSQDIGLYCELLEDIMMWNNNELFRNASSLYSPFVNYDPENKGHWYIPAVGELEELYGLCAQEGLNEAIEAAGGKKLYGWYWSSTELETSSGTSQHAYTYNLIGGYAHYMYKYDGIAHPYVLVREVRKF